MKSRKAFIRPSASLNVLFTLAGLTLYSQAATLNWSGTTSTAWSVGTNWAGTAPASSITTDIARFTALTVTNQPTIGATATSITGLIFGDGTTTTAAYTVSGTANLTIGASGISKLLNSGASTVSAPVTLGAAQSWSNAAASNLLVSGAVTTGGFALSLGNSSTGTTTISGTIGGTGGVTSSSTGTGAVILSGANTYTGATTVSAGTLQIGDGTTGSIASTSVVSVTGGTLAVNLAASGNLTNAIANAGTVAAISNNANTLSGIISGAGALSKSGTGTTTLTGANAYTGATTVNAGTLQIGNGTLGSIASTSAVTVNTNGTLGINLAAAGNFTNAITNGGIVAANSNNANTISGAISGAGSLSKSGTGTATLTGANAYTGTTTVSAGTLQVGDGTSGTLASTSAVTVQSGATLGVNLAASGSLGNTIANSGTIAANSSNANTLSGLISGTGVLAKSGTGTLTLTGANAYTGSTTVNAGTLQVGDGTSGNLASGSAVTVASGATLGVNLAASGNLGSAITNAGSIVSNSNNANTISGAINGLGTFTKSGTGTTTLSAANTYSGATSVNAGTLVAAITGATGTSAVAVSGATSVLQVNSGVTINSGVTLSSSGSLIGLGTVAGNVINGGIVAPGISGIGTLTVTGNYTQNSTGALQIGVTSPTTSDKLVVSGTTTLAGSLAVSLSGVTYGDSISYLTSGSAISGSYSSVTDNSSVYRARSVISGSTASILIAAQSYSSIAGLTPNQKNVATALDSWIPLTTGDESVVTLALDQLTLAELPYAFESISAGFHAGASSIVAAEGANTATTVQQNLSQRSLYPSESFDKVDNSQDLWTSATGNFSDQASSNLDGEKTNSGDFLVGYDHGLGSGLSLGLFAGYGTGSSDFSSRNTLDLSHETLGAYLNYRDDHFYTNGLIGYGLLKYDTSRQVAFGTIDRTADGSADGHELFGAISAGYDFHQGNFSYGPQASFAYSKASVDSFKETGADSLDLSMSSMDRDLARLDVGARADYEILAPQNVTITPYVQSFWRHESRGGDSSIKSSFTNGVGGDFVYNVADEDSDAVVVGGGLAFDFSQTIQAGVSANVALGQNSATQTSVSAVLNWKF